MESNAMHDLVRKYIPNATDTMCEFILWERIKSYPCGSLEQIEHELLEYSTGYDPEKKIAHVVKVAKRRKAKKGARE
jgi:hypothetical protein